MSSIRPRTPQRAARRGILVPGTPRGGDERVGLGREAGPVAQAAELLENGELASNCKHDGVDVERLGVVVGRESLVDLPQLFAAQATLEVRGADMSGEASDRRLQDPVELTAIVVVERAPLERLLQEDERSGRKRGDLRLGCGVEPILRGDPKPAADLSARKVGPLECLREPLGEVRELIGPRVQAAREGLLQALQPPGQFVGPRLLGIPPAHARGRPRKCR